MRSNYVVFKSKAYMEIAVKMFIYDYSSESKIAGNHIRKAIDDAIEFTFPCNGDGELFRRKLLKELYNEYNSG